MVNISLVKLRVPLWIALMVATSSCSSPSPTPPSATKSAPPAPAAAPQDTIEYLASDGAPRTAWLEPVEVKIEAGVIVNTIDPDWRVKNPDGTLPRVKEIYITATDQTVRKVWVEAKYDRAGDYIDCKFKNARPDGSDDRPAQEDIWLLDRNRNPFRLTIPRLWGNQRVPKFFIG